MAEWWESGGSSSGTKSGGSSSNWYGGTETTKAKKSNRQKNETRLANDFLRSLENLKGAKKRSFQELYTRYGADIPADALKKAGLPTPKKDNSMFAKLKRTATGPLSSAMDILQAPGQAVLHTIHGEPVEALKDIGKVFSSAIPLPAVGDKIRDKLKTDPITFREATGIKAKGAGGAAIEFAGTTLTDPLTYVSFGTSTVAKSALKTVAEQGGEQLARRVATTGLKGLAKEDKVFLKNILAKSAEEVGASNAERTAAKQLRALKRGGTGGAKVLGRTVASPGAASEKRLAKLTGSHLNELAEAPIKEATTKAPGLLEKFNQNFRPRAQIRKEIGPNTETLFDTVRSQVMGTRVRLIEQEQEALLQAVKAKELTKHEAATRLRDFINKEVPKTTQPQLAKTLAERGLATPKIIDDVTPTGWQGDIFGGGKAADAAEYVKGATSHGDEVQALLDKGFTDMRLGGMNLVMHPTLAKEVKQLAEPVVVAPKFSKLLGAFRRGATASPGFHIRNFYGDVSRMGQHGLIPGPKTAAEARLALKGEGRFAQAIRHQNVTHGDIFHVAETETEHLVPQAKGLKKAIHPLRTLRQAGEQSQDFLRAAAYIKAVNKTGNAEQAAALTRKVLFDYHDLTPMEKKIRAYAVPFYTFMRKNLPFQAERLIHEPRSIAILNRAIDGAMSSGITPELLPGYLSESGAQFVGDKAVVVDLPFASAMSSLGGAAGVAASIPGLREALPESLRPEGGVPEATAQLLEPAGGGLAGLVKSGAEITAKQSFFTGAPIGPGQEGMHLLRTELPAISVLERILGGAKKAGVPGIPSIGKISDGDVNKLYSALLGIRVQDLKKGSEGELYRRREVVERLMKQLGVPTSSELKEQQKAGKKVKGLPPKAPSSTGSGNWWS